MKPSEINKIVKNVFGTNPERGEQIYDFLINNKLKKCLELGFANGVSTTWIAGAIDEMGDGNVVSVDTNAAKQRKPSAEQLISQAGLNNIVNLNFEDFSYTWFLMRNMEKYTENKFDFIFIDGAHTWDADGFAFFLAEPMLREGGWILFDDLDWTPAACGDPKEHDWVQSLPEEVRSTPAIRLVWEKLVLNHSSFGNFIEDGNWGWAQKVDSSNNREFQYRVPVKSIVWRRIKDNVKKVVR